MENVKVWELPKIRKAMNELQFIVTSAGEIGVGWSNRGENGGFDVLMWMSDDLRRSAIDKARQTVCTQNIPG